MKNIKITKKTVRIIEIGVIGIIIILLLVLLKKPKKTVSFYEQLMDKGFKDLKEEFICKDIKNKDLLMSTRKYSFIAIDGEVYDISFYTKYENGENCEKRDFETKLVSHLDNYVIGENGKIYSTYENLKEREDIKYNYDTKDIVQKADKYILKKDGNIYYETNKDVEKIDEIKYSKKDFQGKIQSMSIISSDYSATDERKIVVLTDKAVYYSYSKDEERCRKFADVKCEYQMVKDEFLSKNRKSILFIDDTILITKDGKVIYLKDNYFDNQKA